MKLVGTMGKTRRMRSTRLIGSEIVIIVADMMLLMVAATRIMGHHSETLIDSSDCLDVEGSISRSLTTSYYRACCDLLETLNPKSPKP